MKRDSKERERERESKREEKEKRKRGIHHAVNVLNESQIQGIMGTDCIICGLCAF